MANDATIVINGNLVRDPELREVGANKTKVASFTVAVNTNTRRPDGTYEANFYDVSLWGPRGEAFMQRAVKGTGVEVIGDLTLGEYVSTKDNKNHYRLRVDAYKTKITARGKDASTAPAARPATMDPMPDDADPWA